MVRIFLLLAFTTLCVSNFYVLANEEPSLSLERKLNPARRVEYNSGSSREAYDDGEEYDHEELYYGIKKGKGSKRSKSSSGKGGKKAKKSGKKGKGGDRSEHAPSAGPISSASADSPARPPSPIPPEGFTPPGVGLPALQEVALSQYAISYTLANNFMPMQEDYIEVETLTNEYFKELMNSVIGEISGLELVQFITIFREAEFRFGEPIEIVYESTAFFSLETTPIPAKATLDSLFVSALDDFSDYLGLLRNLGDENAFSTTIGVEFVQPTSQSSLLSESSSSDNSGSSIAMASAVGMTVLIAGALLYRQKNSSYGHLEENDFSKESAAATIAGETLAGDTFDGNTSFSNSTTNASDEERGVNRDKSSYSNNTSDADSQRNVWDELSTSSFSSGPPSIACAYNSPNIFVDSYELEEDGTSSIADVRQSPRRESLESSANKDAFEVETSKECVKTLEDYDTLLGASKYDRRSSTSDDKNTPARRPLSVEEIELMLAQS